MNDSRMTQSEAVARLRKIAKLPADENGGMPWPEINYTYPTPDASKLRLFNWRAM